MSDALEPLLAVRGLRVAFGTHVVVDDVSLDVNPGEVVALVGESGSGKSVTAMTVLGLVPSPPARVLAGTALYRRPGAEAVDLLGADPRTLRSIRGREIAMVFQEPTTSLNPVMPVGEQIAESLRVHRGLRGPALRRAVVAAMEDVGIRDAAQRRRAYPHEFSGGMRQRIMIAIAMCCEPRVLIADEPTTALDVTIQAQVLDLIASGVTRRGVGVLLITHDLSIVAERADRVMVMRHGRVVEAGATAEVLQRPRHAYTSALLRCVPRLGVSVPRLATVGDADPGSE